MLILKVTICLAAAVAASAGGEKDFGHPRRFFAHDSGVIDGDVWYGGGMARHPWREPALPWRDSSHSHELDHYYRRRPHFDCGGSAYRVFNFGPRRSFCCGGLYYQDIAESLNCCGLNPFDTRLYSCNGGATIVPLFRPSYEVDWRSFVSGRYGSGNARIAFDQHKAPSSCGTVFVPHSSPYDLCCDGNYFPNPHLYYGCCGPRCYDSRWYRCTPSREIILVDDRHHHHHHPALYAHWGGPYLPPVGVEPVALIKDSGRVNKTVAPFRDAGSHSSERFVFSVPSAGPRHHMPAFYNYPAPYLDWNGAVRHHNGRIPQRYVVQPVGRNAEKNVDKSSSKDEQELKAVATAAATVVPTEVPPKVAKMSEHFAQSLIDGFVPHVLSIQEEINKIQKS